MNAKINTVKVDIKPVTLNIRDLEVNINTVNVPELEHIKEIEIEQLKLDLNPFNIDGLKVIKTKD